LATGRSVVVRINDRADGARRRVIFAIILMLVVSEPIACWKAKAQWPTTAVPARPRRSPIQHGYSKAQIVEVRRRCGL
jgi:hypothetical protein